MKLEPLKSAEPPGIVVRKQDGVTYSSVSDGPLPTLRISVPAQAALELPAGGWRLPDGDDYLEG